MKPKFRSLLLLVGSSLLAISYTHAATLTWDANADTAGQTDGGGAWLNANQWWTGSTNASWTSGDHAIFGNGGAGGAVTLASPTTVGSLTVKYFTGTYTLGTSTEAITLNNGITRIGGIGGTLNIISPLILGGAQTWTNNSNSAINVQASTTLNGNLTFDGVGIINSSVAAAAIGGSGNIIKNGTGQFNFSAAGTTPVHTFTGDIVVNGGSIGFQDSGVLTGRNVHLTGGYLGGRFGSGFIWTDGLGEDANQIRITGGTSGLSGEGGTSSSNFQIGTAGSTLVWGASTEGSATGYFNPTVLLLNGNHRMNANGKGSLNNAIDLNGATRTILSTHVPDSANNSGFTVSGAIINSSEAAAGLNKTGTGNLILTADNTYDGATTINGGSTVVGTSTVTIASSGSIILSGANGRLSSTSALNLTSGGILRMVSTNAQNTVNRMYDTAAITINGGGGLWWENAVGANSFAETMGNVTVNSGLLNINLTTNQTGDGTQTLTIGSLARSGASNASSIAFAAGVTGPEASGNKNMIVVTGAGTTAVNEIVGTWATTGTAPNVQTDYAVYVGDYVKPLGATSTTDDAGWTTTHAATSNYAWGNGTSGMTVTTTRNINTLRHTGGAETMTLDGANLGTFGILNGATGVLTLSRVGSSEVVTLPTSAAGQLHINTGNAPIISGVPIADNGGALTLVKSGTVVTTTQNGNTNLQTTGTLVLNGVNTYTGDTIINGGTLRIGTSNTANGAVLGNGNYAGNIAINGGGLLHISTNANQTLSGVISGDGALMKTYNGTLTLSGNNTYTGKTSITPAQTAGAGVLEVSSINSVVGGSASSSLGAPTTVENGTIDLGGPTNIQGGATLRYIGTGETTDRVVNVQMGANISRILDASGSGLLKFTSTFTSVGGTFNTTTVQLIGTGTGEISQGLPFAFPNLTKNGAGTWTLGGAVENSGTTTITAGTLILNGSKPGAGTVAVNGTSTLGGSGTIAGTVTVAAGAKLSPGNGVGTLTFTNDLNISAMAGDAGTLNYELGPIAASDKIVAGTINIGSGVLNFADFNFSALSGLQNGTYTLIQSGGLTGELDSETANLTGSVGAGNGTLQITATNIELVVSGIGGTTPYEDWAGSGVLFDADANDDGVANGLAFLLGAVGPNLSALNKLPTVTESAGGLVLSFQMLDATARGTAALHLEYSTSLATGTWTPVTVPDTSGTVDDVIFTVSGSGPLNVSATIPVSKADGGKLFGRLKAQNP
jgi:autotransporter-associated beta strand protein